MAFRAIVNGSDCGPSNPLQNLLKHADHHPLSSRLDDFDRSSATLGPSTSQTSSSSLILPRQSQTTFLMNDIKNELDAINRLDQLPHPPNHIDPTWQHHFISSSIRPSVSLDEMARMDQSFRSLLQPQASLHQPPSMSWSQQFIDSRDRQLSDSNTATLGPSNQALTTTPVGFQRSNLSILSHQNMLNMNTRLFSPQLVPNQSHQESSKARIVELTEENWEVEFAKVGDQLKLEPSHHRSGLTLESLAAPAKVSCDSGLRPELVSPASLSQESTQEDQEADADFLRSLEATWRGLAANLDSSSISMPDVANWTDITEDDFLGPGSSTHHPSTAITPENVGDFLDNPEPYPFQSNNPFVDHPDPFQEGQRLIQSGAPLSEAALAFEAACRSDEARAEYWRMLGETQAADEKEQLAIKAFQKAVGCQDESNGQSSWMSLAICWVNEAQEIRAMAILERWLKDAYPAIAQKSDFNSQDPENLHNPWSRHSAIVEKFLQAARAGPEIRQGVGKEIVRSQVVDVDVQVGLGVLFYSNSEYDRAKDCFEAALGVNPNDFLLWNRLGATLANGGKPEEAIGAYQKALELRPTFTRAIYNLGVSCLNIHCYRQAAEHFLAALSFHSKAASIGDRPLLFDGVDGSENLWYTLRRAFLYLGRSDLADLAVPKTNVEVFREHGFDF